MVWAERGFMGMGACCPLLIFSNNMKSILTLKCKADKSEGKYALVGKSRYIHELTLLQACSQIVSVCNKKLNDCSACYGDVV